MPEAAAFSAADRRWMDEALDEARQALFVSAPNPHVGCLIVREGTVLARASTQRAGALHAEALALQRAREQGVDVRGATAYVTLEPCCHTGRTPPCADALIAAGIARVVVALRDPNPRVAGGGIGRLRAAGVRVDVGLCAEPALWLNAAFCARMTRGTPWVRAKVAASFDGRTALPDGRSQWITGEAARADGHAWRARAGVVLTGMGTVRADDPRLTVRAVATPRQPVRAVLDSALAISEQARVFDGGPVWLFTTRTDAAKAARLAARNAQTIVLPAAPGGGVALPALLQWLAAHEVNEVHVEAGAHLLGTLAQADLIDEWVAYVAPRVLGDGRPVLAGAPLAHALDGAGRYEFLDTVQLGPDLRLHLRARAQWQALRAACGLS